MLVDFLAHYLLQMRILFSINIGILMLANVIVVLIREELSLFTSYLLLLFLRQELE